MQKQAPSIGRILDRRRVHAVVLRADPVPVDRLRRPDPAEARELQGQRLLPGDDARSPGVRRAVGGVSVGKVKEISLAPPEYRVERQRHDRGRDRDRARVRADLRGRQGDPAPEDAARRDLHRADARHRAGRRGGAGLRRARPRTSPTPRPRTSRRSRRGDPRHRADPGRDPDRRDLQRARRGDEDLVPALARELRRSRSRAAAST